MRKITAILLTLVLIFGISIPVIAAGVEKKAIASQTKFVMDGKEVTFDQAYEIEGSNYIQLRSVAKMLSGTKSQFNVYWDDVLKQAVIETGSPYTGAKSIITPKETFKVGEEITLKNTKITIDKAAVIDKIPGSSFVQSKDMNYFEVTFTVLTSNTPERSQYWNPSFFVRSLNTNLDEHRDYHQVYGAADKIYPNELTTISIYFTIPKSETIQSITISDGMSITKLVSLE